MVAIKKPDVFFLGKKKPDAQLDKPMTNEECLKCLERLKKYNRKKKG